MSRVLTAVIIDDQKSGIDVLINDLDAFNYIKVTGSCKSPAKGRDLVLESCPDILFLDVEMPGMSGLEFLESIRDLIDWPMSIVFYSAFDKYIIDALRSNATDFLLKPYKQDELNELMERVSIKHQKEIETISQIFTKLESVKNKIAVQTVTGINILRSKDEILCFERDKNRWQVTLTDGQKFCLKAGTNTGEILRLSDSFVSVYSGCILNIDYLASIENKTLQCRFYPPYDEFAGAVFISRRNYSRVKMLLDIM